LRCVQPSLLSNNQILHFAQFDDLELKVIGAVFIPRGLQVFGVMGAPYKSGFVGIPANPEILSTTDVNLAVNGVADLVDARRFNAGYNGVSNKDSSIV
jgi:hypothetical protein